MTLTMNGCRNGETTEAVDAVDNDNNANKTEQSMTINGARRHRQPKRRRRQCKQIVRDDVITNGVHRVIVNEEDEVVSIFFTRS